MPRSIQWKLPDCVSTFVQRAGRAARGPGTKGLAVLLVEPSAYTTANGGAAPEDKPKGKGKGKSRAGTKVPQKVETDPDAELDSFTEFISKAEDARCRRAVLADIYDCQNIRKSSVLLLPSRRLTYFLIDTGSGLAVPCCDVCDPSLLDKVKPLESAAAKKRRTGVTKGILQPTVQAALHTWRDETHSKHHSHSLFTSSVILDDDTVDFLASINLKQVQSAEGLRVALPGWYWWDDYGAALFKFLNESVVIPEFQKVPSKPRAPKRAKEAPESLEGATSAGPDEGAVHEETEPAPKRQRLEPPPTSHAFASSAAIPGVATTAGFATSGTSAAGPSSARIPQPPPLPPTPQTPSATGLSLSSYLSVRPAPENTIQWDPVQNTFVSVPPHPSLPLPPVSTPASYRTTDGREYAQPTLSSSVSQPPTASLPRPVLSTHTSRRVPQSGLQTPSTTPIPVPPTAFAVQHQTSTPVAPTPSAPTRITRARSTRDRAGGPLPSSAPPSSGPSGSSRTRRAAK